MVATAFCGGAAGGGVGGQEGCGWCRWWWRPWVVGEEGGSQEGWWLGGEEAQKGLKLPGGEQAMEVMGLLLLCRLSEVRSLENMASASGKLGGVAGVLLGVHICRAQENGGVSSLTGPFGGPNPPTTARAILPVSHTWHPPDPRAGVAPRVCVAPPKVCRLRGERLQ